MEEENIETKKEEVQEVKEESNVDLIAKANEAAERLEKANIEQARLQKRQEELLANARLQGRSFAGQVEKPKEETPKEYADRIIRGG